MKNISFKKTVEIYNFNYNVIFDKDSYIHHTGKQDTDFDGCCYYNHDSNKYIICVPINEDLSINIQTLCHESYHIVDLLCESLGVEHNFGGTNEHIAYLLDYIVGQVLECYEIYKKIKSK